MVIHKVQINVLIDYVMGYLRYGHYEGLINLNDKEFKEFEKNPINFLSKNNFNLNCVVNNYRIEDDDYRRENIIAICDVKYNDLSAI